MMQVKRKPRLIKPLVSVSVFAGVLTIADWLIGGGNWEILGFDIRALYVGLVVFCVITYLFQFGLYAGSSLIQNLSIAVYVTLVSLAVVLLILEKFSGYMLRRAAQDSPHFTIRNGMYPKLDGELGIRSNGSQSAFSTLSQGNDTIFHVRLHTDEHGFRITPPPAVNPVRHALFLGCSFTWGSAVDSAETYAALFQQHKPGYRSYNFGQGGWGPHTTASLMMFKPVEDWVAEKNGFAVYTIIDDQIPRIDNELWHYEQIAGGNQPYYSIVDGKPRYEGLFSEARPVRDWIFKHILTKSNFLKYFRIGIPMRITDADYKKAAELLNYIKEEYTKRFNDSPFYMLLYPGSDKDGRLMAALIEHGLTVLDYRNLFDAESELYKTIFDGHPTPRANREIVTQFLKDIDLPELTNL